MYTCINVYKHIYTCVYAYINSFGTCSLEFPYLFSTFVATCFIHLLLLPAAYPRPVERSQQRHKTLHKDSAY